MNRPIEPVFVRRQTVTIELPLDAHTRILHPEKVILKISDKYIDVGALCYAQRSDQKKKQGHPKEVDTRSLSASRRKQIRSVIKSISALRTEGGKSIETTAQHATQIVAFINWADRNHLSDCLAGNDATRSAFDAWSVDILERYKQQEFGGKTYQSRQNNVCALLEASTGVENLLQGVRKVKIAKNPNGGTEPLTLHDFAHAVALNQCIFDGLCELVLENRQFPYKLQLPHSLQWKENYLWLFPTNKWRLPPHLWDEAIRKTMGVNASWAYDYKNGRLARVNEIEHLYGGRSKAEQRRYARAAIKDATKKCETANSDSGNTWRFTLAMVAQRAFLFLFNCNTGCNAQVARDLETDGTIGATVQNQKFRSLKWRASGKEITLIAPITFMPRLRRFMELRKYLLQGRTTPYLFFSCGNRNSKPPSKSGVFELSNLYRKLLLDIDPQLPKMGVRTLRASVDDYYLRLHDSVVAAAVMGHTLETEHKKYARGSANDHHEDMSSFMNSVSESARRQRVLPTEAEPPDAPLLEHGGRCVGYKKPESLVVHPPIQPNCKDSQGCLFCDHRVLAAGQEDARKVASAAYVMERLILGPKHEEVLRPLISKCDKDLEKIATFSDCGAMVQAIREDVYENENLTPFWADRYQLFLELGLIV
jgi:hypothetical protein